MAPEEAGGLTFLDLQHVGLTLRSQVQRLRCNPQYPEPGLEIFWHAIPSEETRNRFWPIGPGIAYVRRVGQCGELEAMSAEVDDLGNDRYAWTDFSDVVIGWMPEGYTARKADPAAQAKVVDGRLVLLWRPVRRHGRVRVEWTLRTTAAGGIRTEAQRLNRKFAEDYPLVSRELDRLGELRALDRVKPDRSI